MSDLEHLDVGDQAVDERLVDPPVHDEPGRRRALLPREAERARRDARHRFVEIGVAVDDDRVLPSQLRDHPLDLALAGAHAAGVFEDGQAHRPAPCEGHERDVGVSHQRGADVLSSTRQEGQRPRREPGRVERLDQQVGNGRRLLRGLEAHRVAGGQRGGDHAGGDGEREVPGRDDHGDAPGPVAELVALARRRLDGAAGTEAERFAPVVLTEVDGLAHVGVGLRPRLAGLEHHQGRHRVAPAPQPRPGAEQHRGAIVGGRATPLVGGRRGPPSPPRRRRSHRPPSRWRPPARSPPDPPTPAAPGPRGCARRPGRGSRGGAR